jgi:hypothetical protein
MLRADLAYGTSGPVPPYLKRNPRVFSTAPEIQFRYDVSVFEAPRNVYVAAKLELLQVSISHLKDAFILQIVLGRYGIQIRFLAAKDPLFL